MKNIPFFPWDGKNAAMRRSIVMLVVAAAISPAQPLGMCGARSTAMGGCAMAGQDAWAVWGIPSALARASGVSLAAAFAPAPFDLRDLRTLEAACAVPLGEFTAGVGGMRIGGELIRDELVRIAAALAFSEWGSVGIAFTGRQLTFARYGAVGCISGDVSFEVGWSEAIRFASLAGNVFATGNNGDFRPDPFIRIACEWLARESLTLVAEFEKERRYPGTPRAGLEYRILEPLAFRVGMSDAPATLSIGGAVFSRWIECGYAAVHHQELGWSHIIEVDIMLGREP